MQESPGLKQDWSWDIRSFSVKNRNISFFLWTGTILPFLQSDGNISFARKLLKMSSKGLYNEFPHIFNIRMLILSWPWALLGLRFWIIFDMSYLQVLPLINACQLGGEVAKGVYSHFWSRSIALQKRS